VISFEGAKFSGGMVTFTVVKFSGGKADFSDVGDWLCQVSHRK
jgi:hypothetical protein